MKCSGGIHGRVALRLACLASVAIGLVGIPATAQNRSLAERLPPQRLQEILLPRGEWSPFPQASQRSAWEQLPADARQMLVTAGEACLETEIPRLPATMYLEYRRVGNRSWYQDEWMIRRKLLNTLALAECVEGDGRFLDRLADIAWAICEESSWTFPAHIGVQRAGSDLPDTTEPIVALFSAETASSLAWVVYLLEQQLDEVSPQICQRIRREIDARILTPYLERDDFGWMGFGRGGRPNNWNPWINSNVLAATLLLEPDATRRREIVDKVLRSLDNFFVPYPADGSCDEGPSYWGHAGASLFDNLELLYSATNGQFAVYDDPVVQNIGRFIYRTHITGNAFVCVGDCDPQVEIPRDLVYRYGRRIGDREMQRLATFDLSGNLLGRSERGLWSMMRPLYALFDLDQLRAAAASSPPLLRDVWLGDEDLQLMVARDAAGTVEGWFVAGWGGHNAQSHNHNDVGNFVVYLDGSPVLIDVGRPTYTRQTFSGDRYKIWAMQSAFHNLPTVNGVQQGVGRQFAAKYVQYTRDDTFAELRMNLAAAYGEKAGIESWQRTFRLDRGKFLTVSDRFALARPSQDIAQSLMTSCKVSPLRPGQLEFSTPGSQRAVRVDYEPPELEVTIENIELQDEKLMKMWGADLRRVRLKAHTAMDDGFWTIRFSPKTSAEPE